MGSKSPQGSPPLATGGRRARDRRDWWPQEFRTMVAPGESTTAGGWSSTPDRCWVPLLAALIDDVQASPVRCVNSGIGANVISTKSPYCSGLAIHTKALERVSPRWRDESVLKADYGY